MRYVFLLIALFTTLPAFAKQPPNAAPRVESFLPQGTVKRVRQAVATFSEAMVRFGDAHSQAPFTVSCPVAGQGHWIDSRQWLYDFSEDVPAGQRCSFTLRKDLKSLSNRAVTGPASYTFDTGGPSVVDSLPGDGSGGIDENQVFLLALDAAVTPESVSAQVYCGIEGLGERIGVDVWQGEARQQALSAVRNGYRYFFQRFPNEKAEAERLVVLKCRRSFPPDTAINLVWGRGVSALGGLAATEDQTLRFRTRPAFNARFECERVNAQAQCVPFLPMTLFFSAPIPPAKAAAIRLVAKNGTRYSPEALDPVKNPVVDTVTFRGPFPVQTNFEIQLPPDLTDDAGRPLENAASFPLSVATDDDPPLAKFSGEFGIIEVKEGGVLPVTLRNLESRVAAFRWGPAAPTTVPGQLHRIEQSDGEIIRWIKKVKAAAERRGEWTEGPDGAQQWKELTGSSSVFEGETRPTPLAVPKPLGDKAFEVVGIPLQQPGFYVVELASPRLGAALLGEAKPRYVATSALVTNLAVHFKWGRERSLVWVTTLDDAKPVPNAAIRISQFCSGAPLWEGSTGADGMVTVESGPLPEPNGERDCTDWNEASPPLFVSARIEGDLGFTQSGWNRGIQPSDFGLTSGSAYQSRVAHGVFDRTLLRAGETLSMKLFLRERVMAGFAIPGGDTPDRIRIRHAGSGQTYTQAVSFDGQGIAESSWVIPRDARLGSYQVALYRGDQWAFDAGQFQVQQFRVPTLRAVIQPAAGPWVNPKEAQVDLFVGYLGGGGAKGLPVKLRTQIRPRVVSYPDYADYSFGGEDVAEGIQDEAEDEYSEDGGTAATPKPARVLPLILDRGGAARATISDLPASPVPQELVTELDYQDANGERLTVAQNIPLWPARVNLGLRTEGWVASKHRLRFHVLALDLSGKPLAGQRVRAELLHKTTFSYRKRLIGGFYAYENQVEVKRLETHCEGAADRAGVLACDLAPGVSGHVMIRATAKDGFGNSALATQDVWIETGDDWWFDNGPADRMDVLPERRSYERGETARFQVRSPFREATALVTVEREGVIDAFVVPLSGKSPVVAVPLKDHYAPNVYVSVLAVRGRPTEAFGWLKTLGRRLHIGTQDDGVTALVDLNKPAYRLGVARIDVGWAPNRLDVRVTPERETFKVREQARVKVAVKRADGGPLPAEAELAFAAVDEGLLELRPNTSWRLLDEMMGQRGIEVRTATAQMQVVGKRHYGRKAAPQGGGGGRQAARELFDTLLLWRGRVPLDGHGEAEFEVPLNDSLTAFRLAAVASAGAGLFGTGSGTIRTTQDLVIHSGLPPLVREGDSFQATFTVRNASDRSLTVRADVRLQVRPDDSGPHDLAAQDLSLAAGEAKEIRWPVDVPAAAEELAWELAVEEHGAARARDSLRISQRVVPAVPVRVHQATLVQLDQPLRMAVAPPADALPGRGGVRVALQARLGDDVSGIRDDLRDYRYTCLEQRVSRAVGLRDRQLWEAIAAELPNYLDSDGLLKYFPSDALRGSEVLTAYVLAITEEAGWALPKDLQTRIVDGLRGFVDGRLVRTSQVAAPDLVLRKLAAIEALARHGAAKPAMLGALTLDPRLWPTSAVIDWLGILDRVREVPQRDARLREAQQILKSRFTVRGTTMALSAEANERLWWLMRSADLDAVRTILALSADAASQASLPKLVAGALERQTRGHWDTTVANAWGALALEKFGRLSQGTPVAGNSDLALGTVRQVWAWTPERQRGELDFPWPAHEAGLELAHHGPGAPWATILSRAALPLQQADFSGYAIRRSIQPVDQQQPGVWSRGDVARIRLELEAQAEMTWVVVDDPVPAGASILGSGLGRDSALLAAHEQHDGGVWPIYEERHFDAFRAYYDYVPKGTWTLEYTVRFNNPGRFGLPPTRVEALYAPDVYGEWPNPPIEIRAEP